MKMSLCQFLFLSITLAFIKLVSAESTTMILLFSESSRTYTRAKLQILTFPMLSKPQSLGKRILKRSFAAKDYKQGSNWLFTAAGLRNKPWLASEKHGFNQWHFKADQFCGILNDKII